MTVDLVLDRSKQRQTVVDKRDDIGVALNGGHVRLFDKLASDFEHRFMREGYSSRFRVSILCSPSLYILLASLES